MTQAYVAEQAGITQAMLCQIERGQRIRPSRLGKEIADILGCKMEELLEGGQGSRPPKRIQRDAEKVG